MHQQKWHREIMKEWAVDILGGKCIACGEVDIAQLEFDHIDHTTKSFSIGWSLNRNKEYLLPELKKCQLLCKICHSIKTGRERNPPHGTRSRYSSGCHCELCRTANAKYEYDRRHS